ncbi:universal stress protein [Aquimarina agarivorans]|uniref:universal stress protein n=1 Tax=Aquimarina agarivorans TaxID=980584 RepID=UPI000248FD09|nr:universal stress protein [Aquimarina agarivorans]
MKNILVPTDFSPNAHNALSVAAQLARKNDSTIHLLHLLELPSHIDDPIVGSNGNFPEAILFMKSIHSKFKQLIDSPLLKGLKTHEDVNTQPIPQGILKSCNNNEIDFIIVGSHGKEAFSDLFVGSNTEKIVRTSSTPVLVVKEPTDISTVKNIVFACNFKNEEIPTLNALHNFAEEINAQIHLLYVNTPRNFKTTHAIEEEMKAFLTKSTFKKDSLHIYNDTSVERGVLNFSNDIKADLICVDVHERKGLSHFINGSISEDLINHTQIPILTYKLKA